jgi:hypothetical protein
VKIRGGQQNYREFWSVLIFKSTGGFEIVGYEIKENAFGISESDCLWRAVWRDVLV